MNKRVLAMLMLMVVGSAAAAAEVRLRSSAGCGAAVVRLADVAEILGDDARVAAALAEIPLCPAPAVGSQKTLTQHEVRQLLGLSGVERSAAVVTGSETVTIIGEARSQASILARRPLVATGVRQTVFEVDAEPGRKKLHVRAASEQPAAPVPSAKQSESAPLVERGAMVTVNARTAGVRITTSGKALAAGAAGETIAIELADSKQRVLARVSGPQSVEVAADASSAATTTRSTAN